MRAFWHSLHQVGARVGCGRAVIEVKFHDADPRGMRVMSEQAEYHFSGQEIAERKCVEP